MHVTVGELRAVGAQCWLIEQDLHALEPRIGRTQLLLDPRAGSALGGLADLDQALAAVQLLTVGALPRLSVLAHDGVGVDAVAHRLVFVLVFAGLVLGAAGQVAGWDR